MSYEEMKSEPGLRWIEVLALNLDTCSLTMATGDCAATTPTDGYGWCFNTRKTCTSTPSFDNFGFSSKTYYFKSADFGFIPALPHAIPCIVPDKVRLQQPRIDIGNSLGEKGNATLQMYDFPFNDVGLDPYLDQRPYDPMDQGTFWGKYFARHDYSFNRHAILYRGFVDNVADFSLDNLKKYATYVDKITGPNRDGQYNVVLRDFLRQADDSKISIPEETTNIVTAAIGVADLTDITLKTDVVVGDLDSGVDNIFVINDELIRTDDAGLVTERGAYNTIAEEHEIDDSVQKCEYIYNEKITDVIIRFFDKIGIYTKEKALADGSIDDDDYLIIQSDWDDVFDEDLVSYYVDDVVIPEPTGLLTLLEEIIKQYPIIIWFDMSADEPNQTTGLIRLSAIKDVNSALDYPLLTEDYHIVKGSFRIDRNDKEVITRINYNFGMRNPLDGTEEFTNHSKNLIIVDGILEGQSGTRGQNLKTVNSRWYNRSQESLVRSQISAILKLKAGSENIYQFKVHLKDGDHKISDIVQIRHSLFGQDMYGNPSTKTVQIISAQQGRGNDTITIEYEAREILFIGNVGGITNNAMVNYDVATSSERSINTFICGADNKMSDGNPGYVIQAG